MRIGRFSPGEIEMIEIPILQDASFPMAWWLSWFVVAFLAYGLLAIWFWRSARRHDRTVLKSNSGSPGGPI